MLGRQVHITSPVMSLSRALEVHSRILLARRTSWAALRAEWICLMQHKKTFQVPGSSPCRAQSVADSARKRALKKLLTKAALKATKTLQHEHRRKVRALQMQARQDAAEQSRMKSANRAAALLHKQALRQRVQWLRRRDLTTEELLCGPLRASEEFRECSN